MKLLKSFFILLSLLTISSCELIDVFFYDESNQIDETGSLYVVSRDKLDSSYSNFTEKKVTASNVHSKGEGDLFLIKYNSTSADINGEKTGYVNNSTTRSLQTDDIYQNDNNIKTPKYNRVDFRYTNDFLNEIGQSSRSLSNINNNIVQNYSTGDTKSFYIIPDLDNQNYVVEVPAELKYVSKYAYVWFVTDSKYTSPSNLGILEYEDFKNLGDMFDKIYPVETSVFGSLEYDNSYQIVPSNEKVSILIYDVNNDAYKDQTSGTFGYFYSLDLYNTSNSNKNQIFYLDDYFTNIAPNHIYSTLAHEFQHMLNHISKKIRNSNSTNIETWYTEMLSLICEEMLQDTIGIKDEESPKSRLNLFNMNYYKGFTNWRNNGDEVLISYANAYAFAAFLARNYGGSTIIKEIANNSYVNQESITKALQKFGYNDDFNSVCRKFAQIVIFTQDCNNNSFYSLNRKIEEQNFTFDAINLNTEFYANKISNKNYYGPVIFTPLKEGGLPNIGSYAFSVHYIGKDILSTDYALPTTSDIELYTFECK